MSAFMTWLSMGGYSRYVWTSYGVVSVLLILNALSCRWQKKRIEKSLRIWLKQTS